MQNDGRLLPWSSLAAGRCVDEMFSIGVVGLRRRRRRNLALKDFVVVRRERVASWVDVDGRGKTFNVQGFLYAPLNPIMLAVEDGDVGFSEMVVGLTRMLQHC